MTLNKYAKFASSFLATSALVAATSIALANGQGTPMEPPPPPPAPEPMPAPAPVVEAPILNWQGGYVGGHLGYGFRDSDDEDFFTLGNIVDPAPEQDITITSACYGESNGSDCDENDDGGFDGGLRAGYDWQSGKFVYGALVEASFVDMDETLTVRTSEPVVGTFELSRDVNFVGAARLRAGAVLGDTVLLYATGGVAYADYDVEFGSSVASVTASVDDDGKWGWQLGAGLETLISPSFSLGIEYIYTSFDDEDAIANVAYSGISADVYRVDDRFDYHSVRATAAYRFGN